MQQWPPLCSGVTPLPPPPPPQLAGEDVLRSSGLPFAVVRPCALTEEPRGAPLQLDQGDTIKVRGGGGRPCSWTKGTPSR